MTETIKIVVNDVVELVISYVRLFYVRHGINGWQAILIGLMILLASLTASMTSLGYAIIAFSEKKTELMCTLLAMSAVLFLFGFIAGYVFAQAGEYLPKKIKKKEIGWFSF